MHGFMRAVRWVPLAAVAAVVAVLAGPAEATFASIGVGIQANPVRLAGAAKPGGSYQLPDLYVVNTGSQAESVSVSVQHFPATPAGDPATPAGDPAATATAASATAASATAATATAAGSSGGTATRQVPASWIHATTPTARLAPRKSVLIPLRLITPPDAQPGTYASDIVVTGYAAASTGQGVRFGAAAATGLEFRVAAASSAGGAAETAAGQGYPAWKLWLIVALLVAAAAATVTRWYRRRDRYGS